MERARLIELLLQNAERIRDDLILMETGQLKIECHGADVTEEQMARYVRSLVNLETIITLYGHADARNEAIGSEVGLNPTTPSWAP